MAKQGQTETPQAGTPQTGNALEEIAAAARKTGERGLPPVHLWNPPFCGDLDMRIARDGTWFYLGTPIGRPALVRLFSSVLKREGDKHFLVTPVEKVGIRVDDAPFMAVEMQCEGAGDGRLLHFRTNVDDWVTCDAEHRLRFEMADDGGLTPYLHVRSNLWAKVTRALYYDLVELGGEQIVDSHAKFGVTSSGAFFAMSDSLTADSLTADSLTTDSSTADSVTPDSGTADAKQGRGVT